jgi:hypothetical protein
MPASTPFAIRSFDVLDVGEMGLATLARFSWRLDAAARAAIEARDLGLLGWTIPMRLIAAEEIAIRGARARKT